MDKPNNISLRKYIENIYDTGEYKSTLSKFTYQLNSIFSQQSGLSNDKTIDSIIKLIEHEIETLSNKEPLYSYNFKIDLLKTVFEFSEESNNPELFNLIKENSFLKSKQPTRNEHEQISEFIIDAYKRNYLSQDLKEEWAELIKLKFKHYSFSFQFDELLAIIKKSENKKSCFDKLKIRLNNRNIHLESLVKNTEEELYKFLNKVKRYYMTELEHNRKNLFMLDSIIKTDKAKDNNSSPENISENFKNTELKLMRMIDNNSLITFSKIEDKLRLEGYLVDNSWKKTKRSFIKFCLSLYQRDYILKSRSMKQVFKLFEERYNFNGGQETEESKYKKLIINELIDFPFIIRK